MAEVDQIMLVAQEQPGKVIMVEMEQAIREQALEAEAAVLGL